MNALNDCYSPHTGEHIATATPAPWMGRAGIAAPEYVPGVESAFFAQGAWEVREFVPTLPVPQTVTPAQGLMALYELKGITEDDILTAINSIGDPALGYQALIAFKKATAWERDSESMGLVAQLLALTEADKDALFTLGATYINL